jgi:RNA polymerase sigma-70 factor (ECF subfamily)
MRLLDENDLVQRMLRGEQRAFDEFFDAFAARLGAFAARRSSLDASALEDVVQVTMINAIRGLATFRGGSTLFTWLCQICRNQLADVRRKAERQPRAQSLDEMSARKPTAEIVELVDYRDPLEECAEDSTRSGVRRTINQLPASYARILELRYGDDLTVPEIARLLQLSESAAESRLVRARQAFRESWGAEDAGSTPAPAAAFKDSV